MSFFDALTLSRVKIIAASSQDHFEIWENFLKRFPEGDYK